MLKWPEAVALRLWPKWGRGGVTRHPARWSAGSLLFWVQPPAGSEGTSFPTCSCRTRLAWSQHGCHPALPADCPSRGVWRNLLLRSVPFYLPLPLHWILPLVQPPPLTFYSQRNSPKMLTFSSLSHIQTAVAPYCSCHSPAPHRAHKSILPPSASHPAFGIPNSPGYCPCSPET